jgi:hypothetical protein
MQFVSTLAPWISPVLRRSITALLLLSVSGCMTIDYSLNKWGSGWSKVDEVKVPKGKLKIEPIAKRPTRDFRISGLELASCDSVAADCVAAILGKIEVQMEVGKRRTQVYQVTERYAYQSRDINGRYQNSYAYLMFAYGLFPLVYGTFGTRGTAWLDRNDIPFQYREGGSDDSIYFVDVDWESPNYAERFQERKFHNSEGRGEQRRYEFCFSLSSGCQASPLWPVAALVGGWMLTDGILSAFKRSRPAKDHVEMEEEFTPAGWEPYKAEGPMEFTVCETDGSYRTEVKTANRISKLTLLAESSGAGIFRAVITPEAVQKMTTSSSSMDNTTLTLSYKGYCTDSPKSGVSWSSVPGLAQARSAYKRQEQLKKEQKERMRQKLGSVTSRVLQRRLGARRVEKVEVFSSSSSGYLVYAKIIAPNKFGALIRTGAYAAFQITNDGQFALCRPVSANGTAVPPVGQVGDGGVDYFTFQKYFVKYFDNRCE